MTYPVSSEEKVMLRAVSTNPAAGANPASTVVPKTERWQIKHILLKLTTSSTTANRYLKMYAKFLAYGNPYYYYATPFPVSASKIAYFNVGEDLPEGSSTVGTEQFINIPIPGDFVLLGYGTITFELVNIQSGDDFDETYVYYYKV